MEGIRFFHDAMVQFLLVKGVYGFTMRVKGAY
jgi:hypothetical protein